MGSGAKPQPTNDLVHIWAKRSSSGGNSFVDFHRNKFNFPDPTGGAYSAPPDPLAALRGLTSRGKGGVGRGKEGWGGERKGSEGRDQAPPQNSGSKTAPANACHHLQLPVIARAVLTKN